MTNGIASYRTPLARARGLGSGHAGTKHFWRQRLTGLSNIVVIAFLVYAALTLIGAPREVVKAFFEQRVNALLGVLLAISTSVHMRLGMQVIIEDYLRGGVRVAALVLNSFVAFAVAVASVLAVAKLFLGV
jgi:succinate dehydrogenase / fumarate reductase membrane anchor subunit